MKNNKNIKHTDTHGKMAETSKSASHKAGTETSKAGKAEGHKTEKGAKSESKEEDRAKSAECGCKYF